MVDLSHGREYDRRHIPMRRGQVKLLMAAMMILVLAAMSMAEEVPMQLMSSAFSEGQTIPAEYTCDGKNISPPLAWSDVPAGTKSFALISDDPDAPGGMWVHWVLYNLPSTLAGLKEKVPTKSKLPDGTLQGTNDFGKTSYGGPCPPGGTHRYFFKLYALDVVLPLGSGATKAQLESAMKGHTLSETRLMGMYQRRR